MHMLDTSTTWIRFGALHLKQRTSSVFRGPCMIVLALLLTARLERLHILHTHLISLIRPPSNSILVLEVFLLKPIRAVCHQLELRTEGVSWEL